MNIVFDPNPGIEELEFLEQQSIVVFMMISLGSFRNQGQISICYFLPVTP